jgi:very-short-patch-repair endonuclease
MAQPTRKNVKSKPAVKKKPVKRKPSARKGSSRSSRPHPKYGTSKLEKTFSEQFLDKLGVEYTTQFEAKDIKRFYDFKVGDRILIEVDGDYYHARGLVYEEMNPMQKRNRRVDGIKDEWARSHGYLLIRVPEHEIRTNPGWVMGKLREILGLADKQEDKKKRH